MFHVRRRPADYVPRKRKKKPSGKWNELDHRFVKINIFSAVRTPEKHSRMLLAVGVNGRQSQIFQLQRRMYMLAMNWLSQVRGREVTVFIRT